MTTLFIATRDYWQVDAMLMVHPNDSDMYAWISWFIAVDNAYPSLVWC